MTHPNNRWIKKVLYICVLDDKSAIKKKMKSCPLCQRQWNRRTFCSVKCRRNRKTNAICFFFPCIWKLKILTWEETSGQYELERIPEIEAGEPSTEVWLNMISTHCMSVREHQPESCWHVELIYIKHFVSKNIDLSHFSWYYREFYFFSGFCTKCLFLQVKRSDLTGSTRSKKKCIVTPSSQANTNLFLKPTYL